MKVIENYEVCYPNPLNLKVGDKIQLYQKDVPEKWKGWNWCKDSTGNEGWISETYFQRDSESSAIIIKNYTAKEVSASAGENVTLLYKDCGWAWVKKDNGDEGWLPVEVLEDAAGSLPIFETERLYLREVKLSDSESYQNNFVDYEIIQHLSAQVPWPYPDNGVEQFLKDMILPRQGKDRWTWAIFLKGNKNEVIGVVDLWKEGCPEHRGFWLAKKHWGKGFMTEAVTPVMDYAFNELGFEKLIFANAVGNKRSRRVKEKTGARYIENRPAKFVNSEYKEHEIWELTKENWERYKAN